MTSDLYTTQDNEAVDGQADQARKKHGNEASGGPGKKDDQQKKPEMSLKWKILEIDEKDKKDADGRKKKEVSRKKKDGFVAWSSRIHWYFVMSLLEARKYVVRIIFKPTIDKARHCYTRQSE